MPDNPNKPTNPGKPGKPDNPGGGPPTTVPGYLAALYAGPGPLRPIDLHEYATGEDIPAEQRGAKGRSVAADLKQMIRTGEVFAVYSEEYTDQAVRYGLTAAGRETGKVEHQTRPPKGKKPPKAKIR